MTQKKNGVGRCVNVTERVTKKWYKCGKMLETTDSGKGDVKFFALTRHEVAGKVSMISKANLLISHCCWDTCWTCLSSMSLKQDYASHLMTWDLLQRSCSSAIFFSPARRKEYPKAAPLAWIPEPIHRKSAVAWNLSQKETFAVASHWDLVWICYPQLMESQLTHS